MFYTKRFRLFAIIRVKNDRPHACLYILCNSRWEKFGDIRNNLFVQGGADCWIISPSRILRLWNVCAEERTRQVKECDGFFPQVFSRIRGVSRI